MSSLRFPELLSLVAEIKEKVSGLTQQCDSVRKQNAAADVDTSKGISLLDAKIQVLLSYLGNVSLLVMLKLEGQRIEDHPVIARLIELRVVLEKIRPIDQKLKYQIDKLVKLATEPTAASELDPLRARPNPANLVSMDAETAGDDEDDDEDDSDDDEDGPRVNDSNGQPAAPAGVYVPPRIKSVHYDGDEEKQQKRKGPRTDEHRYHVNRFMLEELRDEMWDGPEEQREESSGRSRKRSRDDEDRMRYEEEHFTRLPGTKRKKASNLRDGLSAIHDFGEEGQAQRSKSSKSFKGKKSKKGGGKKKGSIKRKRS